MYQTAEGWKLDVDRGPDWIFVRPHAPKFLGGDEPGLADSVWNLLAQCFTYRAVVELDSLPLLNSPLIGQLVLLSKRVHSHGGVLRLCGVSAENRQVLHTCRLDGALPSFESRGDAVMGFRPNLPR